MASYPERGLLMSNVKIFIVLSVLVTLTSAQGSNPQFTNINGSSTFLVKEDVPIGYVIVVLEASNPNNGSLVFAVENNGGGPFAIPTNKSELQVTGKLDYERAPSYQVTLTLRDPTSLRDLRTVQIDIIDVPEDNLPNITVYAGDITLPEESPVGAIVPFNYSVVNLVNRTANYTLMGQASVFNIEPQTGSITLNSKINVDGISQPNRYTYTAVVLVTTSDERSSSVTFTLTIQDINDNPPKCQELVIYRNITEETITPQMVYTLTCSDADLTTNNSALFYSIVKNNTPNFTVNTTGTILSQGRIDYETIVSETLLIQIRDGGTPSLSTTATVVISVIPINDNPPVFTTWVPPIPLRKVYSLPENSPVGKLLFTIQATDADKGEGGTITYNISVTNGSIPVNGVFNVQPDNGQVTLLSMVDAEGSITMYNVSVQASDGNKTIVDNIGVTVTDVNDNVPRFLGYLNVTINEQNATASTVIATLSAADADRTPAVFTYNLSVVYGSTQASDWLINSTSGQLKLRRTLDLDKGDTSIVLLQITVQDGGVPTLTGTSTLTIQIQPDNEFTPMVTSSPGSLNITLPENVTVGSLVTEIVATDNDTGPEGVLKYNISGGNTGDVFYIDYIGKITTVSLLNKTKVDFYNLTINIFDSGVNPKTTSVLVYIKVTNFNKFVPECTPLFSIIDLPENTSVSSTVSNITCIDNDGNNLTYTVMSPENSTFGYSSLSRSLTLVRAVDYDSPIQLYNVFVLVSDGTYTTTVKFRINLTPVNEDRPHFAANKTFSILENKRISNPFLTYTANDSDYSPHNIVNYTLQSDPTINSLFAIDLISGDISLLKELDYEILPKDNKTYLLYVVAHDGGGWTGTGTVTVSVLDVNDNSPKCSQEIFTWIINETQTVPYSMSPSMGCSDAENATSLSFNLNQTPGNHFSIANQTVQLINSLDYENATSHLLTIGVTDGGSPPLITTVMVYVSVLNVNDGPPVFPAYLPVYVMENVTIGQSIIDVSAIDPDGSDPVLGDPQYSITGGDPNNQFAISTRGNITLRRPLDFETKTNYSLVVMARERGGQYSSNVTITIYVNDTNDEIPVCNPNYILINVKENEPVNYTVATLSCTDRDAGSILSYTITSGNTTNFKLLNQSLRLSAPLDYEKTAFHDLTVTVSDGVSSHNVPVSVVINVADVDEGPPVFDTGLYVVNVSEAVNISTVIRNVNATDPDSPLSANGIVRYLFASNINEFLIDTNTGNISVVERLDRETVPRYNLTVRASDASNFTTTTVIINVLDVNDNAPVFTASSYRGSISENTTAGTSILTVTAYDRDDPNTNNNGKVSYAIVGGSSNFSINSTTGVIRNLRILDADSLGITMYTLIISATDSGGQPGALNATALVNIVVTTVNNHQPVFTAVSYSTTVNETQFAFGDIILKVTASDNDTGIDGQFTFGFTSVQKKFSLTQNGTIGEVRLKENLDFDKNDTLFIFEVVVTDKGVAQLSSTATVTVYVNDDNDNPPMCASIINVDKVENTTTNIAQLSCSDVDKNTALRYSLISVTPNSTTVLVSSLGAVSVSSPLDYELADFYTILIKVEDDRQPIHNTTVTINLKLTDLNDNNPSFFGPFTFELFENETISNRSLYRANATGNDGPLDVITYSLQDKTYFEISPVTGEISLKGNAPDYETVGNQIILLVCAEDTPNPTKRKVCQNITVTIKDVNDVSPVFNPAVYSAAVSEDVPVGFSLSSVTATDGDRSPAFRNVTYSVIEGNSEGKFSINSSGALKVVSALDYEVTTNCSLVIQASDGLHYANVSYSISVRPVNEFTPVFNPGNKTLSLPENTVFGSNVTVSVSATDADRGVDGVIFYRIDSGPFNIDPNSGRIKVTGNLDRETQQLYILRVEAIDKGSPARTGTLTLTVEVTDENDNWPICSNDLYPAFISEDVSAGSTILTLICQDDDKDPANLNNKLTYSIVSGENIFEVDEFGVLKLKPNEALDREKDSKYTLTVRVADSGTPVKLSTTVSVVITVNDVNDNAPVITALFNRTLNENTQPNSVIGTVSATDKDEGQNAKVMFQMTNGNNGSKFSIDQVKGSIMLVASLDYETTNIYYLEITATDQGIPPKSSSGTVTVRIADVNDNPPICSASLYMVILNENTKNSSVANLSCSDIDTVGSLTYNITAGNINNSFSINPLTGSIMTTTNASLDYEIIQSVDLEVSVSDGLHTIKTYVKVAISDVDEYTPVFVPSGPYNVSVKENLNINSLLIKVNASDGDTFDSKLIFGIFAGNEDEKFFIDPITGSIRLLNSLDFEQKKFYNLTLRVTDSGDQFSSAILNIFVDDVNDNRPVCNDTFVAVSVDENVTTGDLFTPACYDADTILPPNGSYSLQSGGQPSIAFNTTTGKLFLKGPLDYENMTFHDIYIKAFDGGPPDVGVVIHVHVNVNPINEFSPQFTPSSTYGNIIVPEDTPSGSKVVRLNATDEDKGFLQGTVRYSIVSGDPNVSFDIDEFSGEIKTTKPLDRETVSNYTLSVSAVDDMPGSPNQKTSNATVIVMVTDANDNTPMFTSALFTASVSETAGINTDVVTVTAKDRDDPNTNGYGLVTYTLASGRSEFSINSTSGVIKTTKVLDADAQGITSYTLVVVATDSGGAPGALNSSAMVIIKVITVNEFAPVFNSSSYSVTIDETQFSFGDVILVVSANDNDTGLDGDFNLAFVLPQTKFALIQDGNLGKIVLSDNLDFESNDTVYQFQIKATDKGIPTQTGTADVTIIVNDVNDNPPICINIINIDRREGMTNITTLNCTDRDKNTVLTYSVASVKPSGLRVFVSNTTGAVSVSPVLDYETGSAYEIQVLVIDATAPAKKIQNTTVTINLRVIDFNDNPPSFTGPYSFTIREDVAPSNQVWYKANATGNDGPDDYVTYSLTPSTHFVIAKLTGEIFLKTAAPDYEVYGPLYTLTVCAEDTPSPTAFTACQNISVTITDVNDMMPVFQPAVYTSSVEETAIVGTKLSPPVMVYDGDSSSQFRNITYSIISGNSAGTWRINITSGVLELSTALDYESVTSYVLIVMATDSLYTANASYVIQVLPVNEFTPSFNPTTVNINITENTLVNYTFVLQANATDGDMGQDGSFTYSIDDGPLGIDPTSGKVSIISNIDRETFQTFTLLIRATDMGKPARTGTLTLSANVLDVNDNPPKCDENFFTALIAENFAGPTIIAVLSCHDADLDPLNTNNALNYAMTSNTSKFEVTSSGIIKVKDGLMFDREVQSIYFIIVEVSDKATTGRLTTTVTAEVTIADVNDNVPYITPMLPVSIMEDLQIGRLVFRVNASDNDAGTNAQLVYTISSGNSEGKFSIDSVDGTIVLQGSLDYETTKLYELVVMVTDKGLPPLSTSATATVSVVDVNDNSPVCNESLYVSSIPENVKDILVTKVVCKDVDTVGVLAYNISAGNSLNNFRINNATGEIFVTGSATLDFEMTMSYMLWIGVSDGLHYITTFVKVMLTDVNEARPLFSPPGPYNVSLKEDVIVGTQVFDLNATDADLYDIIKIFSIISGDTNNKFTMDSSTGIIRTLSSLDYEQQPSYSLTLLVQDSTALNDTTTIKIAVVDVNDNSPVCKDRSVVVSVDENISRGVLFTPNCSDADKVASPNLLYEFQSGINTALTLNRSSGELSLQGAFDYEKTTFLDVMIKVSDNGTPILSTSINVRININPQNEFSPQFLSPKAYEAVSIPENTTLGTQVLQVSATDDDQGLMQGKVRFQIISGDIQQYFNIDEGSGVITVTRELDRENKDSYVLTVRASDEMPGSSTQKTATVNVSITVTDVNDMTPILVPALNFINVSENALAGPNVSLLELTVRDDDIGINKQTSIVITSGNNENKFAVNGTFLILSQTLNYETTKRHDLILTVTDGGSPKLSSTGRVIINVLPSNQHPFIINVTSTTKTIPEDMPVGTLVFDADASDLDSGMLGQVTYDIVSGAANSFVINPNTGQLYVGSALDYDVGPKNYSIIVRATGGSGASSKTATAPLSIVLSDVNDNLPMFSQTNYVFNVNENMPSGTSVGKLTVTDQDSGVNGEITLTVIGGSGQPYLTINNVTGVIQTLVSTDYEYTKVLYLSVKAVDEGAPPLSSNCLVRVDINNLNDNPPIITPLDLTVSVPEDASVGLLVYVYTATDLDTSVGMYTLVVTNDNFEVNETTGAITVKSKLDRESVNRTVLNVRVIDQGTAADATIRSATATLTIMIGDVNDNSPTITGTYSKSIPETMVLNELVFPITASDPDLGLNSQLIYSITTGNINNTFRIDNSGNLLVAGPLDPDVINRYTLTIIVSDRGTPQHSSTTMADISVYNVNNPPVFNPQQYTFSLDENSNVGKIVGTVTATDDNQEQNSHLTYSFLSFSKGPSSHFTINATTGVITVAALSIDRETVAQYRGTVQVMDNGAPAMTALADFVINVNDLDDNDPVLMPSAYSTTVKENLSVGTSVLQLTTSDADTPSNAAVSFRIDVSSLNGSAASNLLEVDASGAIRVKGTLDYESIKVLTFIVYAFKPNSDVSSTGTVSLTLTDENDNIPTFKSSFINAEVAYNKMCNSLVTQVSATDADAGSNAQVTYSIESSSYADLFSIDTLTGELVLDKPAEANKKYTVVVKASDRGNPPLTSTATVRIDAFDPYSVVIELSLSISKSDFLMRQPTFLTNLQDELRKTNPTAVLKLWCIEEQEGTAITPGARRKRQSIKPVKVSVYVLRDANTDSLSNISQQKDFITGQTLLSALASTDGTPNNNIKAGELAYFNMQEVRSLSKVETNNSSVSWWDTVYGPIVTAILLAFGVALLCLVIFCCCRHHRRKRDSESHSSEEVVVIPPEDYTSRQFKGYQVGWLQPTYRWPTPVYARQVEA